MNEKTGSLLPASRPAAPPRNATRRLSVGGLPLGGGAEVLVQSMLNTSTEDVAASLAQIDELVAVGCELIRVAIPHARALDGFERICEASPLPVVADVHFDFRLAVEAARRGAAKLRINPGNIGDMDMVDAIIDAAGQAAIPVRIGVNAGSLSETFRQRDDLSLPQKLAASAVEYVEHFESQGFDAIVLSAKAH
ncbi:MAG: flavodoxin-dependent (E)-4-hydroxy-3-methylbut-2-enyl-diphosphate synthase, partial [Coriobacteriales bacterium]|nr:flavodoxin-dependent (E)-4-hydroxy-3-methylbut-2-enyl-diphosphate synthase [Coriobacteriales bacterium]